MLHVKRKKSEKGKGKKRSAAKREAYSMIRSSQYWAFGSSFFTFLICLSKRIDMINVVPFLSLNIWVSIIV